MAVFALSGLKEVVAAVGNADGLAGGDQFVDQLRACGLIRINVSSHRGPAEFHDAMTNYIRDWSLYCRGVRLTSAVECLAPAQVLISRSAHTERDFEVAGARLLALQGADDARCIALR